MKSKRTLPLVLTTVAALVAGATIATAQDSTTETDATVSETQGHMIKAGRDGGDHDGERRGDRHGNRHGGGRDGGRGGNGMMMQLFGEVDADGDGTVTQDEIDTFRTAKVSTADASGDGGLSIDEFETLYSEFTHSRMVDAFQALDEDGDGVISEAELDQRVGSIVDRMDRNDDGALSIDDRGRDDRG